MQGAVRIPLRAIHAAQHAAVAALILCVAWGALAVTGSLQGGPTGQERLAAAARAYTLEIDSAFENIVEDAKVLSLVLGPRGAVDQNSRALQNWLRLNPMFVDVAHVTSDGIVQAAAERRRVGRSIAGQPWFRRARDAQIVVTSAPRETGGLFDIVTTMGPGTDDRVLLRVSSAFFQTIERRVRIEHGVGRDVQFTVTAADGARLAGAAQGGGLGLQASPSSASVGSHGPTGWFITSHSPSVAPTVALPGMPILAAGLAIVLGAALVGWFFGARMARSLARLIRAGGEAEESRASRIREVAEIFDEVETRAASEQSQSRHAGRVIERMKRRLRVFESMSGWTCWEIDLETRQVVWTDARNSESGAADRVIDLDDLAERIDYADRDLFHRAIATAAETDSSHDVHLRLQNGDDELGDRLLVRFVGSSGSEPRTGRVFAVSRRIGGAEVANAKIDRPGQSLPVYQITEGVVHDFNDALSTVLTNLSVLMRKRLAREETELVARAFAGAERGATVTGRLLGLARGADEMGGETDLAETARAILSPAFVDAHLMPDVRVIDRIPDGLPRLRCSETLLEVLLLSVALYVQERDLGDLGISATRDAQKGRTTLGDQVRILFASGRPQGPGQESLSTPGRLETIDSILEAMGGTWHIVSDGTDGRPFLAEVWLAAADDRPAVETPPLRQPRELLIVGSDAPSRKGLTDTLRILGHSIVRASSGEDTHDLLARNPAYDAVVFDRTLPAMSEMQLAVTILQRHPRMKVILAGPDGQLSTSACAFLGLDEPFRRGSHPVVVEDIESNAA